MKLSPIQVYEAFHVARHGSEKPCGVLRGVRAVVQRAINPDGPDAFQYRVISRADPTNKTDWTNCPKGVYENIKKVIETPSEERACDYEVRVLYFLGDLID